MTTLVKLKISKRIVVQDCTYYIGRSIDRGGWNLASSKYRNPYKGDDAVKKYLYHIYNTGLIYDIEELRGHILGCWCISEPFNSKYIDTYVEHNIPIFNKCHGMVLLSILYLVKDIGIIRIWPSEEEVISLLKL